MHIQIGPSILLARRDTVLVVSDGLFDNLRLEEIARSLCKGPLLKSTSQRIQQAQQRMQNSTADQPSKPGYLMAITYRPGPTTKSRS